MAEIIDSTKEKKLGSSRIQFYVSSEINPSMMGLWSGEESFVLVKNIGGRNPIGSKDFSLLQQKMLHRKQQSEW